MKKVIRTIFNTQKNFNISILWVLPYFSYHLHNLFTLMYSFAQHSQFHFEFQRTDCFANLMLKQKIKMLNVSLWLASNLQQQQMFEVCKQVTDAVILIINRIIIVYSAWENITITNQFYSLTVKLNYRQALTRELINRFKK